MIMKSIEQIRRPASGSSIMTTSSTSQPQSKIIQAVITKLPLNHHLPALTAAALATASVIVKLIVLVMVLQTRKTRWTIAV
jgi:hypothetical protein